jgi:hypothetical protein
MWTVPWSEETASQVESKLNAMLWISAASAPRLSSWSAWPECESHTRISVPRSDAVARRVPSRLSARQESEPSCAAISVGLRMSKSSTRKCPFCSPGHASTHVLDDGLSAHRPARRAPAGGCERERVSCGIARAAGAIASRVRRRARARGAVPRTARVGECLEVVHEPQVCKVVHVHLVLEHHDHPARAADGGGRTAGNDERAPRMRTHALGARSGRAHLSRRSLTALTSVRNESSPMHRFWWSSQIITLLGG